MISISCSDSAVLVDINLDSCYNWRLQDSRSGKRGVRQHVWLRGRRCRARFLHHVISVRPLTQIILECIQSHFVILEYLRKARRACQSDGIRRSVWVQHGATYSGSRLILERLRFRRRNVPHRIGSCESESDQISIRSFRKEMTDGRSHQSSEIINE